MEIEAVILIVIVIFASLPETSMALTHNFKLLPVFSKGAGVISIVHLLFVVLWTIDSEYSEFIKIVESFKNSKESRFSSIISIVITAVSFIISPFLSREPPDDIVITGSVLSGSGAVAAVVNEKI